MRLRVCACVICAQVTVWCNNDYLGMGQHATVLSAMTEAVARSGAGAGGTRNISGTTAYHTALERELATVHGKERALLFTSGYVANDTSIATLVGLLPGCVVFSDALNHASLIEGVRHSKAPKHVFRHNDIRHLEQLLAATPKHLPKLIVFESVRMHALCDRPRSVVCSSRCMLTAALLTLLTAVLLCMLCDTTGLFDGRRHRSD
jgi:7-keto-8-aminopelargonate synthetase-like enzyme